MVRFWCPWVWGNSAAIPVSEPRSALILLAETVRMRLVLHAEEGRRSGGTPAGFGRLCLGHCRLCGCGSK